MAIHARGEHHLDGGVGNVEGAIGGEGDGSPDTIGVFCTDEADLSGGS